MLRSAVFAVFVFGLTGCLEPGSDKSDVGLEDTRVTFSPTNPDAGPIVFEFYRDGTALLAFDETAGKGQTALNWRVEGAQLCVSAQDSTRDECSAFTLIDNTLTLVDQDDMIGTVAPL